jgi:hypothetical protein
MRLILKLILAITLSGPAVAATTPEALRELVMAGDMAAVEVALEDTVVQDAATRADPDFQREMFKVFWVTHPEIDAFTAKWLQQNPTSPNAMTARAWYLHAVGYANRGQDTMRHTYSGGIAEMQTRHEQAFALFLAATKAAPRLLAASDGVLVLAQTVVGKENIPLELERIMARYPNRGSLMRAMYPLAPQWGGTPEQVRLLCDRYAPMITTITDYTPDVCVVDAVYFANFWKGPMRDAAHEALTQMTHPFLDYARLDMAMDRVGPATQRLAVFEKVKATRPLTPDEALEWITANNEVNSLEPNGEVDPVYTLAVSQGVDELRKAADQDPLNAATVLAYIDRLEQNLLENGNDYDKDNAIRRVQALLRGIPHSWRAWIWLGRLSYSHDPGLLEKTAPYYQNAIFYSNYGLASLQDAIEGKAELIDIRSKLKATSGNLNQTPEDIAELDLIGVCPLVALVRIADAVCASEGMDRKTCLRNASWWLLEPLLEQTKARGACEAEENAPLETLLKGPVEVQF